MSTKRKFTPEFKAKVALEAIREHATTAELAKKHDVHPSVISKWKQALLENAAAAFASEPPKQDDGREQTLLRKIGELTIERDFLAQGLERYSRK